MRRHSLGPRHKELPNSREHSLCPHEGRGLCAILEREPVSSIVLRKLENAEFLRTTKIDRTAHIGFRRHHGLSVMAQQLKNFVI